MSIMSGLVETETPQPVTEHHSVLGEWVVHHAWATVLAGCVTFWIVLTGLLIWG